MTVEEMNLTELEKLAFKLRLTIARNPEHRSRVDQAELEYVREWIAKRQTDAAV
ncbi:MAG: hypothetical protein ACRD4S_12535 [Candidatus Acidiferrales bacterium]